MVSKRISCRQVAEFRYSILGELFARPPAKGELAERLRELSNKQWHPPGSSYPERYCVRTLERWYARVKAGPIEPVAALMPARRADLGVRNAIRQEHMTWLRTNMRDYSHWHIKLRSDNLSAVTELQPTPSYSTVLRWLHSIGVYSSGLKGVKRKKTRETLSFESMFPGEIWHMDTHKGSRMVLLPSGEYAQPVCIAYIDDHSRQICHCQWVLQDDTDSLVHITKQAFLKHGIPHKVHSDNGSPMTSAEYETGLARLGIKHEKIIPGAAFQNGKIESFWKPLEGRLIKMLAKVKPLTLDALNQYTQPWVMFDYNHAIHSETGQKPIDRYMSDKNVVRRPPDFEALGKEFRRIVSRRQRLTDGTISIEGVLFQIPIRFRHMRDLHVAYSQWDLSNAALVDEQTQVEVAPIFPVDKNRNASGLRARIADPLNQSDATLEDAQTEDPTQSTNTIPPLLEKYLKDFAQVSPLNGYIPHHEEEK